MISAARYLTFEWILKDINWWKGKRIENVGDKRPARKNRNTNFYFISDRTTGDVTAIIQCGQLFSRFVLNEAEKKWEKIQKYSNAKFHLHKSYLLPNDAFLMLIRRFLRDDSRCCLGLSLSQPLWPTFNIVKMN